MTHPRITTDIRHETRISIKGSSEHFNADAYDGRLSIRPIAKHYMSSIQIDGVERCRELIQLLQGMATAMEETAS
jgi:hypothetical protein